LIPQLAGAFGLQLSTIVILVAGVALLAMAIAVLVLRGYIAPAEPVVMARDGWSPEPMIERTPAVELAAIGVAGGTSTRGSEPVIELGH
jgi:hypothetical protein